MIPQLPLQRNHQKKEVTIPLHFRRLELKYILPDRCIQPFLDSIAPYTQPDPYLVAESQGRSSYPVTSLYFDSMDLQSYQDKEAGLLSRWKVRLRTYDEQFHRSEERRVGKECRL